MTFLSYLHLFLFDHVLIFKYLQCHITWIYIYFTINLFLYVQIFKFLTLVLLPSCIHFYTLTFFYYFRLYLFDHLLIFIHWHFYVTYSYTYFNMYCFLVIDILILLTLTHISSCIDFYTMTFLYYLHLFLFDHVLIFKYLHFYVTYI